MIQRKIDLRALWTTALMLPVLVTVGLFSYNASVSVEGDAPPPVLILDAGHGGADGGAEAPDGTLESDLNLDIALKAEALARFCGVDTRMTRQTADIDYPASAQTLAAKKKADQDARLSLIHETPGGILLSIHQNIYPASSPSGIQVFFGRASGSDHLAECLQGALTAQLCPNNRRIAEPIDENIYLMRNANCPAVLVECGFLSNPAELTQLETEEYRMELATVMIGSYLQYIRGTTL